jgi:hypothetical protein
MNRRVCEMRQRLCMPWSESADILPTEYSVYGTPLDVDALLKIARPRGRFRVWREGKASEFGPAKTSGVTVRVFEGTSSEALFRAVRRFLTRERGFLAAAARLRGARIHRGLSTTIFVRANSLPVGMEFPTALLRLAVSRRVPWSVMCVPCNPDGGIAMSGDAVLP